ncbi:MAG: murein biosynthesis integral membrane protein MurJ [Deltaproteobacteria bacterium]|nr:murein biosynthesis integral membrane protein MurJ [Deltaproteobacteria bacterium]
MSAMTLLSRVLGLVREQVRAVYLGTSAASDAFGLASTIPNLFRRLVAEGAMTAAFIPVLAEYMRRGKEEETRAFLSRFFTLLTLAVAAFTVLGILVSPWLIETFFASEFQHVPGKVRLTIVLTQLMWPYLLFVSLSAMLQAVLNAHKIFGPSAFTPVLLNLCIIGFGVGLAQVVPDPSYALVAGFLVGGVVQILFQIPYLFRWTPVRFGVDLDMFGPGVLRVLRIMVPGVFAAGIYQINIFVSQLIASRLPGGAIAALQYSIRLQELVLGLFVVSVAQVILPTLSEQTAADDHEGVKDTLAYSTRLLAFVTLPATLALILLGPAIVRLLFQFGAFDAESTRRTAFALVFHAVGLFPIGLSRVQTQVFYAHKDLRTPTLIAAIVMVVNIVLCVGLAVPLQEGGIALAGSAASGVSAVLFAVILRRRLGAGDLRSTLARLARVALATALMTGTLVAWEALFPAAAIERRSVLALWMAASIALALVVYLLACRALRVNELDGVLTALRRRLRR